MKIAVQIHGAVNLLKESYSSLKEQILDKFKCDIFFSTFGNESDLEWVVDLLKPVRHNIVPINEKTLEYTGINELIEKYKNKTDIGFDGLYHFVRQKNVLFGMYHKYNCNKLRSEYNKKYDIVISTRTDLVYGEPLVKKYVRAAKNSLLVPYGWDWEGGLNDLFAVGPPNIMDIFCSQFLFYEDYMQEGATTHPESLLRYHVVSKKLPLKRFSYMMYLRNERVS